MSPCEDTAGDSQWANKHIDDVSKMRRQQKLKDTIIIQILQEEIEELLVWRAGAGVDAPQQNSNVPDICSLSGTCLTRESPAANSRESLDQIVQTYLEFKQRWCLLLVRSQWGVRGVKHGAVCLCAEQTFQGLCSLDAVELEGIWTEREYWLEQGAAAGSWRNHATALIIYSCCHGVKHGCWFTGYYCVDFP